MRRNVVEYPLLKEGVIVDFIEASQAYGKENEQYLKLYPSSFAAFAVRTSVLLHAKRKPFDLRVSVPGFMTAVAINTSLHIRPLSNPNILAWSVLEI
jgi:hypothetical protein